ncbi:hypothetical protein KQ3_05870 [Bacillus cereus B5-2]|nr:hypothetical protein KQ3_05870 [Bacillus cereus B5-2]
MKYEIHPFRTFVSVDAESISVGSKVKFFDNKEGIVTSIKSVKFLTVTKVEIIGRARFEK